jgi:hypothetical protein
VIMRALLAAISICASASAAPAQSYSASGQVGYLQEWELKASLARTVSAGFRPADAAACRAVQRERSRGKVRRIAPRGFAVDRRSGRRQALRALEPVPARVRPAGQPGDV